jgi:hypothetical protein
LSVSEISFLSLSLSKYLGFFLFSLITISFLWQLMFAKVTDATVSAAAAALLSF